MGKMSLKAFLGDNEASYIFLLQFYLSKSPVTLRCPSEQSIDAFITVDMLDSFFLCVDGL